VFNIWDIRSEANKSGGTQGTMIKDQANEVGARLTWLMNDKQHVILALSDKSEQGRSQRCRWRWWLGVDRMAGWLMSTGYLFILPGVVGMLLCLYMGDILCSENNIMKNVGFK
jgi:hypothetical protein